MEQVMRPVGVVEEVVVDEVVEPSVAGISWAAVLAGAFMSSSFQDAEGSEARRRHYIALALGCLVADEVAVGEPRDRGLAHLRGDARLGGFLLGLECLFSEARSFQIIHKTGQFVIPAKVDLSPVVSDMATPEKAGIKLLTEAADAMKLTARGYHRVLRVARTIADLAGAQDVAHAHVAEALAYRRIGVLH